MKSPSSSKRRRVTETGAVEKLCRRCGEWKPLAELTPHKLCHDGYCATCRACTNMLWNLAQERRDAADQARLARFRDEQPRRRSA